MSFIHEGRWHFNFVEIHQMRTKPRQLNISYCWLVLLNKVYDQNKILNKFIVVRLVDKGDVPFTPKKKNKRRRAVYPKKLKKKKKTFIVSYKMLVMTCLNMERNIMLSQNIRKKKIPLPFLHSNKRTIYLLLAEPHLTSIQTLPLVMIDYGILKDHYILSKN